MPGPSFSEQDGIHSHLAQDQYDRLLVGIHVEEMRSLLVNLRVACTMSMNALYRLCRMSSGRGLQGLSSASKGWPTYVTLRGSCERSLELSGRRNDTLRVIARSGMRARLRWDGIEILRIDSNVVFPTSSITSSSSSSSVDFRWSGTDMEYCGCARGDVSYHM